MSLLSQTTPSDRAGELLLIVRRIRKRTGLSVVPMLIVEGAADELLFEELCAYGQHQVFAAGNRSLVEQLLRHLQQNPSRAATASIWSTVMDMGRRRT